MTSPDCHPEAKPWDLIRRHLCKRDRMRSLAALGMTGGGRA